MRTSFILSLFSLTTVFAGNTRPFGSNSLNRRQEEASPAVAADESTLTNTTVTAEIDSTTNQAASIDETALVGTPNVTEITQPLMNAPSTNMTGNDQQNSTVSSPSGMFTPSPIAMGDSGSQIASIDLIVLNLAFTLERLESSFHEQGLKRFSYEDYIKSGYSAMQTEILLEQIGLIQQDENIHATTLVEVIVGLGGKPNVQCTFNFDSVMKDPFTFISTARTLESVGVSAYLGAAHLVTDKALLTAAASILTLESRHSSLLNVFAGGSYASQPFDIALAPPQVLALAGGFLQGCTATDLGLTSNEPLGVIASGGSKSGRFEIGSKLEFSSTIVIQSGIFCQLLIGGAANALVFDASNCMIPIGINGPVAIYLTSSNVALSSNLIIQDVTIILAGPALIFVDESVELLTTIFENRNHKSRSSRERGNINRHNNYRQHRETEVIEIVVIDKSRSNRHRGNRHGKSKSKSNSNSYNNKDSSSHRSSNYNSKSSEGSHDQQSSSQGSEGNNYQSSSSHSSGY